MSEENKKEISKKPVENPKNEELSTTTPGVELVPVIEVTKAKKVPKKRIKKEAKSIEDEKIVAIKSDIQETTKVIEEVVVEESTIRKVEKVEEFDWEKAAQNDMYSVKERTDLETEYSATLPDVVDKQVIDGTVVLVTDREVVIDINFKSDGVISFNEFKYNPELKAGDTVEVLVEKQEDKNGQLVLSHRRARVLRAWEKVNVALDTGEVVNGQIMSRTKGGMIVDVFGIECFLPGSQIDVKPIRDYDEYVGRKMEFKIVKVNESFRNVVVSHKALIEADLA